MYRKRARGARERWKAVHPGENTDKGHESETEPAITLAPTAGYKSPEKSQKNAKVFATPLDNIKSESCGTDESCLANTTPRQTEFAGFQSPDLPTHRFLIPFHVTLPLANRVRLSLFGPMSQNIPGGSPGVWRHDSTPLTRSACRFYMEQAILTESPAQRVLFLFDCIILAARRKQPERASRGIQELSNCLDLRHENAWHFQAFYEACLQLVEQGELEQVRILFQELRSAWAHAFHLELPPVHPDTPNHVDTYRNVNAEV